MEDFGIDKLSTHLKELQSISVYKDETLKRMQEQLEQREKLIKDLEERLAMTEDLLSNKKRRVLQKIKSHYNKKLLKFYAQ